MVTISQLGFFILYIISHFSHFISSIRCISFFSFSFSCFSPPHTLSYLYPHLLLFSFSPSFKNIPAAALILFFFSLQLSLFVFFFFFYLIPKHSSTTQSRWVIFIPKQLAQSRAVTHLHPQCNPDGSDDFYLLSSVFFSFFLFFCFYCYDLINFKIVFLSLYYDNLIILEFRDV